MDRRLTLAAVAAVALAVAASGAGGGALPRVTKVADGDTITVSTGQRVRLLQIDTPELGGGECYSRAAAKELRRLLPTGTRVLLDRDRRLDDVDRHRRLLRYVWKGDLNVNQELVRRGAATVYFYRGERGKHASRLLAAQADARRHRRGLWGACPGTRVDPNGPAQTGKGTPAPSRRRAGGCDASYPTVCIPPAPPDLDCADVPHKGFRVVGADPHRFDGNRDGFGCEG